MISYYEQCKVAIKRINTFIDNPQVAAENKTMVKQLQRKVGSLREIVLNTELGYNMDEIAKEVLAETDRMMTLLEAKMVK